MDQSRRLWDRLKLLLDRRSVILDEHRNARDAVGLPVVSEAEFFDPMLADLSELTDTTEMHHPPRPDAVENADAAAIQPNEDERREAYWKQLKPAFTAKKFDLFEHVVAAEFGFEASFFFDANLTIHPTCFILTIQDGHVAFRFPAEQTHDAYVVLIVERWWSMLPLIQRLAAVCGDQQRIEATFNLNDEGIVEGLAFCDYRPGYSLIPDPVFIGMKGYASIRDRYAERQIAWEDKADVVFWRGTSTGRPSGPRHELPRVSLCRLCRSDTSGIFDVALTSLVDLHAHESDQSELRLLISDYVPPEEFDRYRYHVDIDGHTNSWPGLMFKLHSGGLVFKVDSLEGYRQWYYERLRPWENYVPVKSDLSDLLDLVAYFRRNPKRGRAIAEEGRRLAQSMMLSAELDTGVRTIVGHLTHETYLRQLKSTVHIE